MYDKINKQQQQYMLDHFKSTLTNGSQFDNYNYLQFACVLVFEYLYGICLACQIARVNLGLLGRNARISSKLFKFFCNFQQNPHVRKFCLYSKGFRKFFDIRFLKISRRVARIFGKIARISPASGRSGKKTGKLSICKYDGLYIANSFYCSKCIRKSPIK